MICFILALALVTLSGCAGGPIARQIASSLALRLADKATASAIEAQERKADKVQRSMVFQGTASDPYWTAFLTSNFSNVAPNLEPLSTNLQVTETAPSAEVSRLVRVELWNTLTDQEKHAVLERSSRLGAGALPPRNEWSQWKIGTGGMVDRKSAPIFFLIPPDFGRIYSGDKAVVEIASLGGLHVARYRAN